MTQKILVIDDDELNRRFFKDVLRSEGYETITSDRGGDAAPLAVLERPDLIILDMCMPDLDGIEATRRIRGDTRLAGIPVIAVTALDRTHEARAKAEGCTEYLQKPISIPGFLNSVNRCLN